MEERQSLLHQQRVRHHLKVAKGRGAVVVKVVHVEERGKDGRVDVAKDALDAMVERQSMVREPLVQTVDRDQRGWLEGDQRSEVLSKEVMHHSPKLREWSWHSRRFSN